MKVKLLSNISWEGEHCESGSVLDLKDVDAHWLIGRGRAIPVDESTALTDRSVDTDDIEKRKTTKKTSKKKVAKKAD